MRASEFITETHRGKPLEAQSSVSPGAVFTIDGREDLYRAMAIMARHPANADDIDPYSFVTDRPMIVTYTDEERDMVKAAFKKMGIPYKEHMPQGSKEPDDINHTSIATGFKGY